MNLFIPSHFFSANYTLTALAPIAPFYALEEIFKACQNLSKHLHCYQSSGLVKLNCSIGWDLVHHYLYISTMYVKIMMIED